MGMSGDTGSASSEPSQQIRQKWLGKQLGKYEITDVLGAGGMGVVLKGHDASIERDVALKVLTSELEDGTVGLADLLSILAAWGACGAVCPQDLDGDGQVGLSDLLQVLASWGPCR